MSHMGHIDWIHSACSAAVTRVDFSERSVEHLLIYWLTSDKQWAIVVIPYELLPEVPRESNSIRPPCLLKELRCDIQ